jgi:hypothetical protein
MTVKIEGDFKVHSIPPETVFLYEKSLIDSSSNILSFDATNVREYDKFDEFVVTLELDNFNRYVREDKHATYWAEKQPFAEKSGYDKLNLVVCYGHPEWLSKNSKEKKSITFNSKDKTVFLCWLVDNLTIIDSIKSNTFNNKILKLHIVLNEDDAYFKENDDAYLKRPKLRSFSLTFE